MKEPLTAEYAEDPQRWLSNPRSASTVFRRGPETNTFSAITKRKGRAAALVMPMRRVVSTRGGWKPSSAMKRSELARVRSFPLSRLRVMPNASASLPGPLVK